MDYSITSSNPGKQRTGCLLVAVHESQQLSAEAEAIDQAADGHLSKLLKRSALSGKLGQSLLLFDIPNSGAERVLLIGAGLGPLKPHQFTELAASAAAAAAKSGANDAASCLALLDVESRDTNWKLRQLIAASESQQYEFVELKSQQKKSKPALRKMKYFVAKGSALPPAAATLSQASAIANGVSFARDLGNRPGNVCTPNHLATEARRLGRKYKRLKVKVLAEAELKKLGMGSLLSVANGSAQPARLITIEHSNGPRGQKPVVFVGKGVTFDTGGISLKPAATMDEMKFDMCGAASVLGTMQACAELDLPLNVVGIVVAVENMPGGGATRPGDIVTSMSGKTIEILNTDAEGRLILCDALTYSERFKPDVVIDIATLTGACVVALGKHPHGLFSNHRPLSDALCAAGERAHDRAWPMPVWDDYQPQLDSNFADMANIGGREAGAVTAACFLSRFAEKLNWAHLDIAGTAWLSGKSKGATGRPVPLLTQFLIDRLAE